MEALGRLDLYPQDLRGVIDTIAPWVQDQLNSGVYKAGFASEQSVYEEHVIRVFGALNRLEELIHANGGPYALGKRLTELDIRVYVTVVRFDMVYHQHFKCNLGSIRHDYPVLNAWLRHLHWDVPGFQETTVPKHIKEDVSTPPPRWPSLLDIHPIQKPCGRVRAVDLMVVKQSGENRAYEIEILWEIEE